MKSSETHVLHLVTKIQTETKGQTTKGTTEVKGKAKLEGKKEGKGKGKTTNYYFPEHSTTAILLS